MKAPLLTETEAAKYLGLSPKTLQMRRWLDRPPTYIRMGRSIRYRVTDLDAFAEAGQVTPKLRRKSNR